MRIIRTAIRTVLAVVLALAFFLTFQNRHYLMARCGGIQPEFIACGKLLLDSNLKRLSIPSSDLSATELEVLISPELRDRAIDRLRTLHPELESIPVEVRCRREPESDVALIMAAGAEPRYVQSFLNALLDEYVAVRKDMVDAPLIQGSKPTAEVFRKWSDVITTNDQQSKKAQADGVDPFGNGYQILIMERPQMASAEVFHWEFALLVQKPLSAIACFLFGLIIASMVRLEPLAFGASFRG